MDLMVALTNLGDILFGMALIIGGPIVTVWLAYKNGHIETTRRKD